MSPEDLLVLLEVARSRAFVQAGHVLGLNHTTVSRRIRALESELGDRVVDRSSTGITLTELGRALLPAAEQVERALDMATQAVEPHGEVTGHIRVASTEAFAFSFVAPVAARLHRRYPSVTIEVVTATRPLGQATGVDIEIGVGTSSSHRLEVLPIGDYALGLFASESYLAEMGHPQTESDLRKHSLVYYIESLQRVAELGLHGVAGLPERGLQISSTNVLVQLAATRAGAGIGLLPVFLTLHDPELVPVLPASHRYVRSYVALLAEPVLRRPAPIAFVSALRKEVVLRRRELLGILDDPPPTPGGNVEPR